MARKLTLKLEDLDVTTFSVTRDPRESRGTMKANEYTADPCYDSQDGFCPTNDRYSDCCAQTYNANSCRASCPNYTCEGITCGILIC